VIDNETFDFIDDCSECGTITTYKSSGDLTVFQVRRKLDITEAERTVLALEGRYRLIKYCRYCARAPVF
jgi:hypothetical protein